MSTIDRRSRSFVCAGLTNKYWDVPRRTLSIFFVGCIMPVANWPEHVFLRAFSKAGAELAPLAPAFYLNVRVLDQVVVPGRMVGCTAR